ncbi:DNA-binding protein, partial [Xanthomonas oryzae pv. oryzae]
KKVEDFLISKVGGVKKATAKKASARKAVTKRATRKSKAG